MKEVNYKDMCFNPFTLIGNEWMLLSAGNAQTGCNTMTISWGHLGSLWGNNDPTAVVYIRQSRYTKKFVAGRNEDKIAKTGLTPVYADNTVYFAEAKLVLVCKKLYATDVKKEDFISQEPIVQCYPNGDYHTLYVGKIEKILARDDEYLRSGTCPAE